MEQIWKDIRSHYTIGFSGLLRDGVSLFLQTSSNQTRMALGKIRKICNKHADVADVEPFDKCDGEFVVSHGELKKTGGSRRRGCHQANEVDDVNEVHEVNGVCKVCKVCKECRVKNAKNSKHTSTTYTESFNTTSHITTTNNYNSNLTTKKTKKTKTKTNVIHLHINALGEEDISHITARHLDGLVGTVDDVVGFFERNYVPNVRKKIMNREWEKFRRFARERVRQWDRQQQTRDPAHKSLCESLSIKESSGDSCESEESDDDDLHPPAQTPLVKEEEVEILLRPPVYDPNSDSEGNADRKRKLLRDRLVEEAPAIRKDDFLKDFEGLIFKNPHNSNVIASTKEGYFKYFDGERWIKLYNKEFFDEVSMTRVKKADETLQKLVKEGDLSEFTRSQVSSMVKRLFRFGVGTEMDRFLRDNRDTTRDGILAAENQEAHLAFVERKLKRKIVRVGKDTTEEDVVRGSTWKKLKRGDF